VCEAAGACQRRSNAVAVFLEEVDDLIDAEGVSA